MHKFKAKIDIIGINPFVSVPARILKSIMQQAGKEKGHIPICGTVNDNPYKQTLVKYSGEWRLYINTVMLKKSPERIGELIQVTVEFDPVSRTIQPHPTLLQAFSKNKNAKKVFDNLPPSRQNEIVRYIAHLKTEASVIRNVDKAIAHLLGKEKFVGREKP
ncbi:MAG: YdeI/OmpD-associated family protein [Chitinophagaceae bacterium]